MRSEPTAQRASCQPTHWHIKKGETPMKYVRSGATTVLLLLASVSFAVKAQEHPLVTAEVPFAFTVNDANRPPGTFTASLLSPSNMIKRISSDGRNAAIIPNAISARKSDATKEPKLVFHRLVTLTSWRRSGNRATPCIGSSERQRCPPTGPKRRTGPASRKTTRGGDVLLTSPTPNLFRFRQSSTLAG